VWIVAENYVATAQIPVGDDKGSIKKTLQPGERVKPSDVGEGVFEVLKASGSVRLAPPSPKSEADKENEELKARVKELEAQLAEAKKAPAAPAAPAPAKAEDKK
jgi:hypothetical protein